jgi:putative nucleotidyltransferase with HDIG domain
LFNKLRRSYFSIVRVISEMIDSRERCSRGHSERVSRYASILGKQLGLPAETVESVTIAGLLHDIGKAGISEKLLSKPGILDPEEYSKIKEHASLGEHILESVEIPWDILGLVRHHHEHYNGQGYPDGLAGEAIPLGARILSVAEAFDVMVSDRPYHLTRSPMQALEEIKRMAGRQFDPAVVAALEASWPSVQSELETASECRSSRNPFPEASEL